jgi:phosphate-selective porin OprO/OprP
MGSLAFAGRTVNDAEAFDAQRALVGRMAGLLMTGANYNLHVGASLTYVLRPADLGFDTAVNRRGVRFRAQPELRVDSTRLIDTGVIDADDATVTGIELAGNWRSWLFQAENFWYEIARRGGDLSDPKFGGGYAQASWVITGESHRYNMVNASYQNPRPYVNFSSMGGWGAWELALRFSHTDLDYHPGEFGLPTPADGVRGGVQDIWTLGLNWYVNPNLKLMANYLQVDVDRLNPSPTAFGPPPASPPVGVHVGQDLDIYALRTQYSF